MTQKKLKKTSLEENIFYELRQEITTRNGPLFAHERPRLNLFNEAERTNDEEDIFFCKFGCFISTFFNEIYLDPQIKLSCLISFFCVSFGCC